MLLHELLHVQGAVTLCATMVVLVAALDELARWLVRSVSLCWDSADRDEV